MTVTDQQPSVVERPASLAEAAEVLRGTDGPLLFRGAGTKQAWGGRPASATVVETSSLNRLLAHNPADMTVAVEAGMPLYELQATLGEKGQWLAFDPPSEAAGATVGGLLATADSGPRRLRYGGLRDLVIGATIVLADGTVARTGGRVIKNVAGYDLAKMMYGSLGTLGLVAEVVLRLHPQPTTSATAVLRCSARDATALTVALMASALEPVAVDWVQSGERPVDDGRLAVRFAGTTAGVAAQRDTAEQMLTSADARPEWVDDAQEQSLWAEMAVQHRPDRDDTLASAATLPTRTVEVAETLARAADAAGAEARLASRPALGLHTARLTGPPEAVARAFTAWRTSVLDGGDGASVLLRERPTEVDRSVDAMGPAPSAAPLLRALKNRLDPEGRCAPGRLGSWYEDPTSSKGRP